MALKKIPFDRIEKIDIVIKNMTDDEIIKKFKPDYLLNLALYDVSGGENIVYMEDENKKSGYLFSSDGIGITKSSKVVWCTKDTAYKSDEIKDYCSGSPVLVKEGKRSVEWGNKFSPYVGNSSHYRTYLGFNDDNMFIGCTDSKYSINGIADYCVSQGMKYAINADGNGSQSLWENGMPIKNSSRRNASWLLIWLKKDNVNKPVIDEGDDEMVTKEIITVDGVDTEFNTIVKDGVTYLEMRKLAETVDCVVGYDSTTKKKCIDRKK